VPNDSVDGLCTELRGADHGGDAVQRPSIRQVHRIQARVRVLAANKADVQQARQLEILNETGLSAEQPRVLEPPHRSAYEYPGHLAECMLASRMSAFDGKVALVTGAGSGIGQATAMAFARAGARVAVADMDVQGGKQTVRRIQQAEGDARFYEVDVTDEGQVADLVTACIDAFGQLDFAHNNAGIGAPAAPLHESDRLAFDRVLAVNVVGVWLCLKYEAQVMLRQGNGAIVNTASLAGLIGFPNNIAYSASKHAVIGITRTAALEYAREGIRVNAVCPAFVMTPMVEGFLRADPRLSVERLARMQPMGRLGTAEEVAEAVLWLCSDAASFITGIALPLDGGTTAR
jgi:NAD(P)-dependent dehydrogenase (short-subunit alcohol dehydrogenase family)